MYVGGGAAGFGHENNYYIVMAYNTYSQKWHQLSVYIARDFAMAVISNQLLLVGGCDCLYCDTDLLGVWEASCRKWTHPYIPMPTPRRNPSAIVYKRWLIVAGGLSIKNTLSTVEVLDVSSNQWHTAPPTPNPWSAMKSVILGNMWYVMGGHFRFPTDMVYSVSLPALVSQIRSTSSSSTPCHSWKTIPKLEHVYSTPVCLAGTLLAVGGYSFKESQRVSSIHHFLPESNKWILAGQLPSPLRECTCTSISESHILLFGGNGSSACTSSKFYIGTLI